MSGFHGAFATGVASQQGTLTLPDTWFRPPFWDLLMLQLLRPNSSNLPCLYSTFHLGYPLVLSRFCLLGNIYNGDDVQEGNAHPSGHLVLSLLGLAYAHVVVTDFPELAVIFPTFLLEYPSAHLRFCFVMKLSANTVHDYRMSTIAHNERIKLIIGKYGNAYNIVKMI